mgnify:CR=1 FL=1
MSFRKARLNAGMTVAEVMKALSVSDSVCEGSNPSPAAMRKTTGNS